MILVLCANAGVDRTYEVPHYRLGGFHHPARAWIAPGGKGVNVGRVLSALGTQATITGFAGGIAGGFIESELEALGVRSAFVKVAGESRACINVIDSAAGVCTRLDECGLTVGEADVDRLRGLWQDLLPACSVAVISGSAPPGTPDTLYRDLVVAARQAGRPVVLDAHDAPLSAAIDAGPTAVKPNLEELEALVGRTLSVPGGVVEAGERLLGRGVGAAFISLAERGAIAVSAAGAWWARAPQVTVINPVGGGDSMVAGLAEAIAGGQTVLDQLRRAVAVGTASMLQFGAGVCDAGEAERLVALVEVAPVGSAVG
jgi:tagatose 6-phosphate kinase